MKKRLHFVIACTLIFIFLIGFLSFALKYHGIDNKYEKCMEAQANEICARQEKEMAKFSAWQPYVKCISYDTTSDFLISPMYNENELLYIFNESEIQKCLNYSKKVC